MRYTTPGKSSHDSGSGEVRSIDFGFDMGWESQAGSPGRWTGAHSPLELQVRRLHYFMSLLETGYRHALQPDPLARSLRAERIALGIDVPELDTVPLWSVKRSDGAVAIPFVEFIVTQICRTLEATADEAGLSGTAAGEDLILARSTLRRVMEQGSPGSATAAPDLPRLGDIFLSRDLLDEVCGPKGILGAIARQCEALLATESVRPGH
jgi:hypothetical protein